MPPFSSKEEKRQYILEHATILNALGITLTEDNIKKMIDDDSKDAEYERASELAEHTKKREAGYNALTGDKEKALENYGLNRIPRAFYNTEDTPEAKAWNEKLKTMVFDFENGAKNFANMSFKAILEFDDDLLTRPLEEVEDYAFNHPEETHLNFVSVDLYSNLDKFYKHQKDDPVERVIANAFIDKYVYIQTINSFSGKEEYQTDKLSVILPKLDLEQAMLANQGAINYNKEKNRALDKAVEAEKKAKEDLKANPNDKALQQKVEKAEADVAKAKALVADAKAHVVSTQRYMSYLTDRKKYEDKIAIVTELSKKGILGKEGIYTRAYRMVEVDAVDENNQPIKKTVKKYITKNDLVNELVDGKGKDIKFEKVSAADREIINNFLRTTQKGGAAPMWTDAETRRKYADVAKVLIESTGRKVSDDDYNKMLTDKVDDIEFNYANDLKKIFKVADRNFAFNPKATVNPERLLDGMLLNGDSPEIREWNENVSLLCQTEEGIKQLARIAAKRLLSIDVKALTEMDSTKRIQYLVDHPIDRYITFIAHNVREAYADTLPENERTTDPVVQALEERIRLFEDMKDEINIITTKASRIASLLPKDLTFEEVKNLLSMGVVNASMLVKSDPVMKAAVDDINEAAQGIFGAKAAEQATKATAVLNQLAKSNVLNNDSIYQKPYLIETTHNEKGELVETKHTGTLHQLAEKAASDSKTFELSNFKFEERSEEEKAKLKDFIDKTPDKVELNVTAEEKKRLIRLRELRTIKSQNYQPMIDYVGNKHSRKDIDPELKSLYANARKATDAKQGSNAAAVAFKYVNEHYEYTKDPIENEKFEVALLTLAMIDGKSAKILVDRINLERGYGGLISKPLVDLDGMLKKAGLKLGNDPEKEPYDFRNPFDKRVQNVKEIYDHLCKDLDPWYHKNGPEFKKMLQSMRNVLDYATVSGGAAPQAVEDMLEEIKEAAKNYAKTTDANHSLGRNRRAAALAMVSALNPKEGEKLLNDLKEEKTWVKDVSKKLADDKQHVTTRNFLKSVKVTQSLNKEEVIQRMEADIAATKAEIDLKTKALEEAEKANKNDKKTDIAVAKKDIKDLTAQHLVKNRILKSIKDGQMTQDSLIEELSKNKVFEQGKKISGDNVYEQVILNMKINQGQDVDNIINEIEKQYEQARLNNFLAKKEAEGAKNVIYDEAKTNTRNESVNINNNQPSGPKLN